MADKSLIEWTEATWNVITGCTLVDEGCRFCYAAREAAQGRTQNHPSRAGLARVNAAGEAKFTGEVRFNEAWLDQPLRWTKPRRIFVCAHGDLFHEAVPDAWIDKVFAVMALAPWHTFQVLTKRPERARDYLLRPDVSVRAGLDALGIVLDTHGTNPRSRIGEGVVIKATDINPGALQAWPLPHVWLGTSVSDQASADARIPPLLAAPAAVRFLSAEPLLGPVDLTRCGRNELGLRGDALCWPGMGGPSRSYGPRLDWVIVGGESGPKARPMNPQWAEAIRDQCQAAGVPFFFKQWGEWAPRFTAGAYEADPPDETTPRAMWHDACGLIVDSLGKPDPLDFFSEGKVFRVGKRRAGRELGGRTWSEFPDIPAAPEEASPYA